MAKAVHIPERIRRRNRRLSGLPGIPRDRSGLPRWQRIALSPAPWATLAMLVLYALTLWLQWDMVREREVDGQIQGFSLEVLAFSAKAALPTVLVWFVVFVLVDRWRPQRLLLWLAALGWGGSVATWLSMHINTWAAEHLGIKRGEMAASQARAAVYIAPFVEEASKATILFLLAILLRHRITTRLSWVTLAGLSAIGFAFTENIIYYGRAYSFASQNIGAGDAEQAIDELIFLRGVVTSWGHWSFTLMTGLGLAIGTRSRSKALRIMAPATGFLLAALGHMFYNSQATMGGGGDGYMRMLWVSGAIMCVFLLSMVVTSSLAQGAMVRARLTDYVRMGWLREADPAVFGTLRRRWLVLWLAAFEDWACLRATVSLLRSMTELATLRDAITRGLVDDAGLEREKELFAKIRALRGVAIDDPRGRKHRKVWGRWRRKPVPGTPAYPGPAGISGNWPAPS